MLLYVKVMYEREIRLSFFLSYSLQSKALEQCFSTFFGSQHPLRLNKFWRHPCVVQTITWGTLICKSPLVWPRTLANPKVCGTLSPSHGNPVGNHCSRALYHTKVPKIATDYLYGPYIKNILANTFMNLKSSINKLQKSRLHIKTLNQEILYG